MPQTAMGAPDADHCRSLNAPLYAARSA